MEQSLQAWWWGLAAGCCAVAALAIRGDRRRHARSDPEKIGWVPWPLVLILALVAAAVCAALALKS